MVLLFMIGLNWERIVSLLAVPKIPILTSSSRKYSTVGTHRNAVPQPEIRVPIEFDGGELQILDKLSGNFVHRSVEHDRRKTPSSGKLDQHGLAGFQNFGLEVRFIDFNDRSHVGGVLLFLSLDRPVKLRPGCVRRIGKDRSAPPGAARRNRTWDSHRWARPTRGAGAASLHESAAAARGRNEFDET